METLFIYLLKSSGLVALFFLAYYFLLRKDTFFTSNRWFLLVGLITSAILPLLVFTKTIWVEPSPVTIDWSQIPVGIPVEKTSFEMDWFLTGGIIYALGIIAFMIRFGLDYYSLTKVLKGKIVRQQAHFKFIDVEEKLAPFSFFNTIVYNSALYSPSELQNIMEHEKVHSEQNHTVDVLITRIFSILFWFNSVIWLYQKVIIQNLEFIADSEAILKISDKKAYQITLLKITAHENCVALSNHFYQSLIKKRIVMLNKNQSNKSNSWKYLSILPALVVFVLFFQIKVVAQEKVEMQKSTNINATSDKETSRDLNPKESDTIKKAETITVDEVKKGVTDKNTEIYVNGKKVSKSEMEDLDTSIIKTIDVNKNGEKSMIKIFTKIPANDEDLVMSNSSEDKLNLERIDPSTITGSKKSTKTKIIKVVSKQSDGINTETAIYIDGIKVDQKELDILDSSIIERMDVTKNGEESTIKIISKNSKGIPDGVTIFVDGKKMSKKELEKMDTNLIESMNVLKGKSSHEKYGKDNENGVVEIITKKK
jgi:hypothetical protein